MIPDISLTVCGGVPLDWYRSPVVADRVRHTSFAFDYFVPQYVNAHQSFVADRVRHSAYATFLHEVATHLGHTYTAAPPLIRSRNSGIPHIFVAFLFVA